MSDRFIIIGDGEGRTAWLNASHISVIEDNPFPEINPKVKSVITLSNGSTFHSDAAKSGVLEMILGEDE